jgi:hypothetical protein
MPISINGTGTITGISAGGLPDDCITTAEIAGSAVTPAKLSGAQTGSAPIYGVRAWCIFDGTTTGTNAPTSAGNVSSVIRNTTGDYTITFSTAMPNANYVVIGNGSIISASDAACIFPGTLTTSSATIYSGQPGRSGVNTRILLDCPYISISIIL